MCTLHVCNEAFYPFILEKWDTTIDDLLELTWVLHYYPMGGPAIDHGDALLF